MTVCAQCGETAFKSIPDDKENMICKICGTLHSMLPYLSKTKRQVDIINRDYTPVICINKGVVEGVILTNRPGLLNQKSAAYLINNGMDINPENFVQLIKDLGGLAETTNHKTFYYVPVDKEEPDAS